jgi:hypothetical protein
MHYRFNITDFNNPDEALEALAGIPVGVTSLDLVWICWKFLWNNRPMTEALALIPAGVTSLDLSNNCLGVSIKRHQLPKVLAAIPAGVTSLNLSHNCLGDKTGDELAKILAAIPAGVTSLGLDSNSCCYKPCVYVGRDNIKYEITYSNNPFIYENYPIRFDFFLVYYRHLSRPLLSMEKIVTFQIFCLMQFSPRPRETTLHIGKVM